MKKIKYLIAGLLLLALSACSSGASLANVGIPSNAKDATTRSIGQNSQLVYMSDTDIDQSCEAQAKIFESAGWKITGEPTSEETYNSGTFTDGKSQIVLMCSEEKDNGKFVGTKVTMTLQGSTK